MKAIVCYADERDFGNRWKVPAYSGWARVEYGPRRAVLHGHPYRVQDVTMHRRPVPVGALLAGLALFGFAFGPFAWLLWRIGDNSLPVLILFLSGLIITFPAIIVAARRVRWLRVAAVDDQETPVVFYMAAFWDSGLGNRSLNWRIARVLRTPHEVVD